jgi:hypothetical protein
MKPLVDWSVEEVIAYLEATEFAPYIPAFVGKFYV